MRRLIACVFLVSLVSAPAAAQIVTPLDPSETYLPVLQFPSVGTPTVCLANGFCLTENTGIPISAFATTTQLNALSARIDGAITQITGLGTQLATFSSQVTAINSQLSSINNSLVTIDTRLAGIEADVTSALEGAAVAAALKDALPNSGDRFAIRVNAAAVSGEFAGALGASVNVGSMTRVHVNYGRSRNENAVSGGVNLSFR